MKLLIQKLSEKAILPTRGTNGAAGLDLYACLDEPETIPPGGRAFIPTGVAVAVPEGYVGLMAVRSSIGVKRKLSMPNGVGVIDSDYRGSLCVALWNTGDAPTTILPGDRIAQILILPVAVPTLELVEVLPETERGAGGFGSTGR